MSARYSRQSGYTIAQRTTRRPTVRTVQRKIKFGPTTAKYMGLAILGILALVMVTRSSNNATEAYNQNAIRTQTSTTSTEVDNLRLEAKREQAIQNIQNTPVKDQLQTAGQVDYVDKGDVSGQVAGASTTKP